MFATKPQLAGGLLDRAQSLRIRAAFVAMVGLHLGQLWAAGDRRFALHLARICHAPPQQAGPFLI